MSTANTAQLAIGLGGLPGASQTLQSAIKAELLGVDLAAFGVGEATAEAVARRDPGAANATLTFVKSGQSLPLPLDLAKALIGQATGSAQIAVELLSQNAEGALSASLRRVSGSPTAPAPPPHQAPIPGSYAFSSAGSALAAAAASLVGPAGAAAWASAVSTLAGPGALDLIAQGPGGAKGPGQAPGALGVGRPTTPQGMAAVASHFESSLAALVPGAGIGYERALARISTMGPDMAQASSQALSRFPQASAAPEAAGPWLAQQARAMEAGQVQWSGNAWAGAPMSIAWGPADSASPEAIETRERCSRAAEEGLAWMRFRIEPEGLGPIDVWAVLLGGGRCQARLRAGPRARAHIEQAQKGFGNLLEAARVDLSISFGQEGRDEP